MIETDAPWCEIRPTHAGACHVKTQYEARKKERFEPGVGVKSRNEPMRIRQVLEVLAAIRGESEAELAAAVHGNSVKLFGVA